MSRGLSDIYTNLILEFSEAAIVKFVDKFKKDNVDEDVIRRYLVDFEKYKNALTIKDPNQYKTFRELEQAVDAAKGKAVYKKRNINVSRDSSMEAEAIVNDEDVTIYKGDSEHKCVKYGSGYSFCISRPGGGNMYNSYRIQNASTFYFIFFKTIPITDDRHIMVLDKQSDNWEWTFRNNDTKPIKGGWPTIEKQFPVLKKYKDLFINNPLTEEERVNYAKIQEFVKTPSLEIFASANYELKVLFVKSGVTLKDEIFKTLDSNLLNDYISVGSSLTKFQADSLNPSQIERYRKVRKQVIYAYIHQIPDYRPTKLDIGLTDKLKIKGNKFILDLGHSNIRVFDARGNKIRSTSKNHPNEWVLKYDANDNLISQKRDDGYEIRFKYDNNDNLIHQKDSKGDEYSYTYDKNNNKINLSRVENGGIDRRTQTNESIKTFKSFFNKYYIV